MADYEVRYFAFDKGFHQEADDRMLDPGTPRSVVNLRKLKNGALGMRLDYDALATTTPSGNGVKLFDVHEFNSRLIGLGCVSSGSYPIDIYEFVNQPTFAWRPTDFDEDPRLALAMGVRNMGRVPPQSANADIVDLAATGGRVALAFQSSLGVTVHIFDPSTDSTIYIEALSGKQSPKAIAIGGRFFFTVRDSATQQIIGIWRYDPAVDSSLTSIGSVNFGTQVTHVDAFASQDGLSFWYAVALNNVPSILLKQVDATGAVVATVLGPNVAADFITVFAQANRVHLLVAPLGVDTIDLYTYALPSGTLEHHTSAIVSGQTTNRQPTMNVDGGGTNLIILIHMPNGAGIAMNSRDPATHADLGTRYWSNTTLNSKPLPIGGTEFFAGFQQETNKLAQTGSNYLGCIGITKTHATEMICAYTDKLIAYLFPGNGCRMPAMPYDASTGKAYWARVVVDADGRSTPWISEFVPCPTDRRQMATVGDVCYVGGGVLQCFDGRQLNEAGFFQRPRIIAVSGTTGGNMAPGSIHQLAAVFETFDSKGKYVQSSPGEIWEQTLGASDTALLVSVAGPLSYRQNGTNQRYGSALRVVIYSTLDDRQGDFTLTRANGALVPIAGIFGATIVVTVNVRDKTLEATQVVYTQGDRGELSGPLPFDSPEPAQYVSASADTLYTGGCPEGSRVQESRPQFVGEELNWSDEIGFQRDTRGDVLAVWRFDERRIIFTASEIFQQDGEGLDDNGQGDLGAPRRIPSDVGLYGGRTGWQSIVEFGGGLFFQGKFDLLYLLPRGGVVPEAQLSIRSIVAAYPNITSASYIPQTETVRFTCNNTNNTDGVVLVYDASHQEWFTEGPFGAPLMAGSSYQGRAVLLYGGQARRQRQAQPPAAFITNSWRSGPIRSSAGTGKWQELLAVHYFGTFRGNCQIQCKIYFDGGNTATGGAVEALETVPVTGSDGDQFHYRWVANQIQCESFEVEFIQTALAGAATAGIEYNFWATEDRGVDIAALVGPSQMS